jgi:hypothetical protein
MLEEILCSFRFWIWVGPVHSQKQEPYRSISVSYQSIRSRIRRSGSIEKWTRFTRKVVQEELLITLPGLESLGPCPVEDRNPIFTSAVDPDPYDPYVFGPPGSGSGSVSQRNGSGSFYHQAKIVRITLIPTVCSVLCPIYDFLS